MLAFGDALGPRNAGLGAEPSAARRADPCPAERHPDRRKLGKQPEGVAAGHLPALVSANRGDDRSADPHPRSSDGTLARTTLRFVQPYKPPRAPSCELYPQYTKA